VKYKSLPKMYILNDLIRQVNEAAMINITTKQVLATPPVDDLY
jgi:hypothetical protein